MTPFCAVVDWGTTSFRLWVLCADGTVLAERTSHEGMLQAGSNGFQATLEAHLVALEVDAGVPVVICGMAGSRQGWREARYVETPVDVRAIVDCAVPVPAAGREIRILPGIAQRDPAEPEVLRGEETQLLGIIDALPADALVCLPGTHSKWIELVDGKVARFSTYLSGELYALLLNHSILRLAIDESARVSPQVPEFLDAVTTAIANPAQIANQLFSIRSSQLLGYSDRNGAAAALSGSVIGLELAGVMSRHGPLADVHLVAKGELAEPYKCALKAAGASVHLHDADTAVRKGLLFAASTFWPVEEGRQRRHAHPG